MEESPHVHRIGIESHDRVVFGFLRGGGVLLVAGSPPPSTRAAICHNLALSLTLALALGCGCGRVLVCGRLVLSNLQAFLLQQSVLGPVHPTACTTALPEILELFGDLLLKVLLRVLVVNLAIQLLRPVVRNAASRDLNVDRQDVSSQPSGVARDNNRATRLSRVSSERGRPMQNRTLEWEEGGGVNVIGVG